MPAFLMEQLERRVVVGMLPRTLMICAARRALSWCRSFAEATREYKERQAVPRHTAILADRRIALAPFVMFAPAMASGPGMLRIAALPPLFRAINTGAGSAR